MEKFCLFKTHDHMDMYPEDHVRTFIADNEESIKREAIKYAQHMNANYSGGTTVFVKVMSEKEAQEHVDKLIAYENTHWQDDSQSFIDTIVGLFNKCYKL